MTGIVASANCLSSRLNGVGRHVDRGEWASGHAILSGLRRCGQRGGCPAGKACAVAADRLMADLRHRLRDQNGTPLPQP
jgi:hypothetical protein